MPTRSAWPTRTQPPTPTTSCASGPAGVGTPQVSLVSNTANLYVVGYFTHATNTYGHMGAGPANPVNAAHVRNDFLRQGDGYLERVGGFDRSDRRLGTGTFFSAMSVLRAARPLGSVHATQAAEQASAITAMIRMFAEGAGSTSSPRASVPMLWPERPSPSLSRYVRDRINDSRTFNFVVGSTLALRTMQAAANRLAVDYPGRR
nr:ribosome-inactivating family protein [Streptomyces sp. TRM68416]